MNQPQSNDFRALCERLAKEECSTKGLGAQAADCVFSEVFSTVGLRMKNGGKIANLGAYVRTAARNAVINLLKQRNRQHEIEQTDKLADAMGEQAIDKEHRKRQGISLSAAFKEMVTTLEKSGLTGLRCKELAERLQTASVELAEDEGTLRQFVVSSMQDVDWYPPREESAQRKFYRDCDQISDLMLEIFDRHDVRHTVLTRFWERGDHQPERQTSHEVQEARKQEGQVADFIDAAPEFRNMWELSRWLIVNTTAFCPSQIRLRSFYDQTKANRIIDEANRDIEYHVEQREGGCVFCSSRLLNWKETEEAGEGP